MALSKNDVRRALYDLVNSDTQGPPDPRITNDFLALLGAGGSGDEPDLSPFLRKDGGDMTGPLSSTALIVASRYQTTGTVIPYAASVALDFSTSGWKSISLTGNIAFTSSNLAADREIAVRIVSDGSSRNLSFPVGWVFVGATAPASIAANKTAILSLRAFGSTDATVVASYVVQA
jgi:hypothetical protein